MTRLGHRLKGSAIVLLAMAWALAACGPSATVGPPAADRGAGRAARGSAALPSPRPAIRVELTARSDGDSTPLSRPIALAVDRHGRAFVVDAGHDRIVAFAPDGGFLTAWGGRGGDAGQFRFADAVPCDDPGAGVPACLPDVGGGVAVDAADRVFVADWGNHRVQAFDAQGRLLARWGREGDGPGEFRLPSGLAVDGRGRVYVGDAGNRRIQVFDAAGAFLGQWASGAAADGPPAYPGALATDGQGRVCVLDPIASVVAQLDEQGRPLARWAIDALGDGEPRHAAGLAVDGRGRVYVAGSDDRIHQFDPDGRVALRWDRDWRGEGRLLRPTGLAVDAQGDIYVADQGRDHILRFRLAPVAAR
jgi:DNA-binding beta-propeller fold protein YncE